MILVAEENIFEPIEQAFDYTDPATHNGTIKLKTISSEGKKYIVSRRYILGDHRDYYLDFIAPSDSLRTEKTGEHGELKLYLNKRLVTRDNFNFEKGGQRQSFAGMANKRTIFQDISDYYNREKLEEDLETFTEEAYEKKVKETVFVKSVPGDPFIETAQFVEGLIIKGGGTILNALPKQAKSFICMILGVSVDAGVSEIWKVEQGNVLYINLERSASSMVKRLAGVNTALGLDPMRPLRFMNVRGTPLIDIMDSIKYQIEKEDIKLVIVDSISRAGMGSLVDDRPAVRITDALNNLVEESDRSWVGIAHRAWSNEHVFGSVQFLAACDVMVDVEAAHDEQKGELGVKLSVTGQNDLPPSRPHVVALGFDSMGLNSARRATDEEFPDLQDERDNIRDRIWNYLRIKGKQTTTQIANDLGEIRDSVDKTLKRMEKKNEVSKQGQYWGLRNR
tara:strand:+ start:483 stop:1832 length:1350 start_codon:yes stop_codon:yes gene_type:complete